MKLQFTTLLSSALLNLNGFTTSLENNPNTHRIQEERNPSLEHRRSRRTKSLKDRSFSSKANKSFSSRPSSVDKGTKTSTKEKDKPSPPREKSEKMTKSGTNRPTCDDGCFPTTTTFPTTLPSIGMPRVDTTPDSRPQKTKIPRTPSPSVEVLAVEDPQRGFHFSSIPSDTPSLQSLFPVADQPPSVVPFNSVPSDTPTVIVPAVDDSSDPTFAPSGAPSLISTSAPLVPSTRLSNVPSMSPTIVIQSDPIDQEEDDNASHRPSISPTIVIESDPIDQENDDNGRVVSHRALVGSLVALAAAVGGGLMFHFKPRRQ